MAMSVCCRNLDEAYIAAQFEENGTRINKKRYCYLGWKGGKGVLVKTIFLVIPTYVMSIVRLPKNFCKSIYAAIVNFWWSFKVNKRVIHCKNWDLMFTPKSWGGMGFKDTTLFNYSLLINHVWRLHSSPNALWARILKSIYFEFGSLWFVRAQGGCSLAWQSVLHGRDLSLDEGRWFIARGSSLPIRTSNWVASGKQIKLIDHSPIHSVGDLMVLGFP